LPAASYFIAGFQLSAIASQALCHFRHFSSPAPRQRRHCAIILLRHTTYIYAVFLQIFITFAGISVAYFAASHEPPRARRFFTPAATPPTYAAMPATGQMAYFRR
jgi:hypothetical protein